MSQEISPSQETLSLFHRFRCSKNSKSTLMLLARKFPSPVLTVSPSDYRNSRHKCFYFSCEPVHILFHKLADMSLWAVVLVSLQPEGLHFFLFGSFIEHNAGSNINTSVTCTLPKHGFATQVPGRGPTLCPALLGPRHNRWKMDNVLVIVCVCVS